STDVNWENVNLVGGFTRSSSEAIRKEEILQLWRCIREAYCAQPLRRFMHGFLMFKEEFELWVFDHSGAYSSGRMGIIESKEIFVRTLCSYLLMSDEELGRDISVLQRDGQSTASFTGSNDTSDQLVEIKPNPILQPRSLINRVTACYETKNKSSMVQSLWSKSENNAEVQFMKAALPIPGYVKYITSQSVYQTNIHLESFNLSCAKPQDFKAEHNSKSRGYNYHELTLPSWKKICFLSRTVMTKCGRKIDSSGSILAFL
ncbi:Bgt-20743-3, partial [Blumeria graminis f. sp. tritici]